MKQRRLLMALMAMMLSTLSLRAWTPDLYYAKWFSVFSMDKMWQFSAAATGTMSNPCTNSQEIWADATIIDYPGTISWAIMSWDERTGSGDDYNMAWAQIYLYDVNNTSDQVQLCQINIPGNGDNDNQWEISQSNIDNYSSCQTYVVRQNFLSYADGSGFLYFVTYYSDAVRNLFSRANNNVGVYIITRWDDGSWETYYERSALNSSDRARLANPQQPTISNPAWTLANGSSTHISFKHGLTVSGLNLYVVEDYYNNTINVNYTSGTTNTSSFHPTNVGSSVDYLYEYENARSKYRAYSTKTYTYSSSYIPSAMTSAKGTSTTLKSAETTFYPPALAQPINFAASDEKDGRIKLTWQNKKHIANKSYDNSDFVIERSSNSSFSTIDKTIRVSLNYQTGSGTTSYTHYDTFPDREVGNKTFYYRIRRANCFLRTTTQVSVNTNWARLSKFTAGVSSTSNSKIKVAWDYEAGIKNSNLTVRITYNAEEITIASNNGQKSQIISGLPSCTPTTFTAQMQVNNQQNIGNSKSSVATLPQSDPGVLDTVTASAGYYNNRVNVSWKVNAQHTSFSSFDLVRCEYGDTINEVLATIPFSSGSLQYSYNDNTCIPGVYYEYKVVGYASCNGYVSPSAEKSAIGFAQPYGVVSGQIAYSGNQAVKEVAVVAEGVGQFNGKSVSMQSEDNPTLEIPVNFANNMLTPAAGTIEFFVRLADTEALNPIVSYGNVLWLTSQNNKFTLSAKDGSNTTQTAASDSTITPGGFYHIAITYTTVNNQRKIILYQDKDSVASLTFSMTTPNNSNATVVFGRQGTNYLTGNLDEIRFWNTARTKDEVIRYMDAYLTGSETGLTGYYRCDDEISLTLFDLSKTGNAFNGRHISMSGVTIDDLSTPTVAQLGHKVYTDENGNYLFNNIPYSTNGSLYNIIPMLGIHEFSPSQRPLFFNSSANTHNAVDFEDVSSFPVSGKVTFDNTNYPVEGCQFYIDGTTLCTNDGEAIETDENGNYSIEVPIGQHYITIKKNGHTFANGGRYPATGKHEFQNAVTNLTFKDSTFVLLTGRVAGGEDEAIKPHGYGTGKATIGQARITLATHGDLYNLNLDEINDRTFVMPADSMYGSCNSVTTTGRAHQNFAHYITILTDPATGEFNVMLPPIDFEVKNIELVHNDGNIVFNTSSIGDIPLGTQEIQLLTTDSVAIDSASYSYFKYSYALDIIHYNEPTLTLVQNTDNKAIGSKYFYYEDKVSGFRDTIPLYSPDAQGNPTYTFGYPCFEQDETYTWQLSAYETYINYDNQDTTLQPFRYGVVNVSNNFGTQVKNANSLMDTVISMSNSEIAYASGAEMMFDSTGVTYYSFVVGEPNILPPYTSNATITYQDAQRTRYYEWTGNSNNDVLVLGSKVSGTNFVTKGPDEVFYILRDPVGSDSYSELQSGQKIEKTWTRTRELNRNEEINNLVVINHQSMNISAPFGVGTTFEGVEVSNKVGPSESVEGQTQWIESKTWTYETTKTVATSDDHEYVGSPADVFIGVGTNRIYGNAFEVYIKLGVDSTYSIDQRAVLSVSKEFGTEFNYSQHHITCYLIPNLEALRNQLLYQVAPQQYNSSFINNSDEPVYITTLSPDDENYGANDTYIMIMPQGWIDDPNDKRIFDDEVYNYNNQIRRWVDLLIHNERCKVMVNGSTQPFNREAWEDVVYGESSEVFADITGPSIDSTYNDLLSRIDSLYTGGWLIQNYSIGGANLSVSETREYSHVDNGHVETDGFMAGVKGENGGTILGVGVEFEWEAMVGFTNSQETGTENGSSSSVTYNVAITPDEALTFDVYQAPDGFGPIFSARGGQTLCPYQGTEVTEYYEPGTEIQTATIPMAEPRLTVQNPIATNVPVGGKALFNIELANLATPDANTNYLLKQISVTNPDGAIIRVDGMEVSDYGIPYMLGASTAVNKTLSIEQTRLDVLDYDSIGIIFLTDCYLYDADTIWISAHFVQTCSEITLNADRTVLNNTTGNSVRFTINGFDQNFRNFNTVQLQYQSEGDDQWHLVRQFPADSVAHINYNFAFAKPSYPDGTYRFRAVTLCQFGNETVNNESEVVTVVVDMAAPEALGLPYPIDGIYTANNQIYVDFNEAIQTGRVLDDNVVVEGVLNAHEVNHSVALNLENNTAASNATYTLGTNSFTLELWLNYSAPGTIFSYAGGSRTGLTLAIDASDHLTATVNGTTYTSNATLLPNRWLYMVVQCDVATKVMSATYAYDDQNVTLFNGQGISKLASSGNIRFGGNGLNAKIHDVALWKRVRSTVESLAERSESKSPYTPDLMSLWRMDEGKGTVAKDNMRQRHLTLSDDAWAYSHVNYALHVAAGDSAMVNISECPIEQGKSYLYEMWFRANGNAELFHLADGSFATSIVNGSLVLNNHTLPIRNYQNNTWHHLAIINPKISTPIVAIDGAQLASPSLQTLPAFASSHIILGGAGNTNDIDIDEVRLWNINTTLDATKLQMGNCLTGEEDGLLAYYPMEAYVTDPVSSQISTEFSLADKTDAEGARVITHSNVANAQSNSVPALVESRPLEYVAHTHTASNERIMVNITEPAQRIEGCWLEIMVKDIVDANGNYSEPIRWTVFVNRNQLLWDENAYTIVKDEMTDTTFTLTIVNNSSVTQSWNLDNVPSCMTLSETSGRIQPLQTKTITCTIDATADRGENEYILYLSGNENMDCPLYITTKVYANKPDWNINPSDYEHSMNIIAYAEVDGVVADDEEDMVAAFVDGELAGVANLQLLPAMGRYYLMMTIYQNSATSSSPRNITFRYWDASTGLVYSNARVYAADGKLISNLTYQDNVALGDIADPIRLEMGNEIEQTISINRGWNWISFNVNPASALFDDILGEYAKKFAIIKSQEGYAMPDTAKRTVQGSIDMMECELGYKLKAYSAFDIMLDGMAAPISTVIDLTAQQWTWFGFIPQKAMTVNTAMSNINPTIGDFIKSQTQFASWDGYQWVGSLKVMQPGQSYVYKNKSNSDIKFEYPEYADVPYLMPSQFAGALEYFTPVETGKYQGNMNITAVVKYEGQEVTTAEVGVFADDECRAAATYDDGYYFITVPGDSSLNLSMKVVYNDSVYTLQGNLVYRNDAVVGTLDAPYVIDLSSGQINDDPGIGDDDPNDPPLSVVSVEAVSGSKVEKVLIDNEVFIIKDGAMYDALGRRRK